MDMRGHHFIQSREGNVGEEASTWQAVAGFSMLYQLSKTSIFHDGKRLVVESNHFHYLVCY